MDPPPIAPGCLMVITVQNTGSELITDVDYPASNYPLFYWISLAIGGAALLIGLYWYSMANNKETDEQDCNSDREDTEEINGEDEAVSEEPPSEEPPEEPPQEQPEAPPQEEKRVRWRDKLVQDEAVSEEPPSQQPPEEPPQDQPQEPPQEEKRVRWRDKLVQGSESEMDVQ